MTLPKPTKNRIFGEILPAPLTNAGLIISTDSNLDKHRCKVLSVGPKVTFVKVGDTLRFDPHSAVNYPWEGKKCVFVDEEKDCLFVM